jgi:hypothetical protein
MPFASFLKIGTIIFLFSVAVVSCRSKSEQVKTEVIPSDSLANYPYWIEMMSDPNVNYYAAVEAFDKYWENREKPTEEDGEGQDLFDTDKTDEEKAVAANRSIEYVYEYKQFLHWQQTNKNLLKPDGTIMTAEEILEQWKKQSGDTLKR